MELSNNTLKFMAELGATMEGMDAKWPDGVDVKIAIEWHGEQIATWGSEGGATIWHFGDDE